MHRDHAVERVGSADQAPKDSGSRVGFEITFWIAPANRVEFLQTVDSLLSLPGDTSDRSKLSCFEKLGGANAFLWRECWDSRSELDKRLESMPVKTLLGAIGVLGRMEELKLVEFVDGPERGYGEA